MCISAKCYGQGRCAQRKLETPPTQSAFTCSKLTIKILEQSVKYAQSSGVFIVNFEHI